MPTHAQHARPIRIELTAGAATTARVLPADFGEDQLRGMTDGHLLVVFPIATPDDVHPHLWERHPAGDEVLLMLEGSLDVECLDEHGSSSSRLAAGQCLIVPRGAWHRLALREPGRLLALTRPGDTELATDPKEVTT